MAGGWSARVWGWGRGRAIREGFFLKGRQGRARGWREGRQGEK